MLTCSLLRPATAVQTFYLDFDSVAETAVATPGLPPLDEIYDYAPEQREMITEYLNSNLELYGLRFESGLPMVPGAGSVRKLNGGFGAGCEGIDFRNLDDDDSASLNTISIFKFLSKSVGEWTDDDVTLATANIAGHEAMHLMGARHHDAYGPVGTGIGTL